MSSRYRRNDTHVPKISRDWPIAHFRLRVLNKLKINKIGWNSAIKNQYRYASWWLAILVVLYVFAASLKIDEYDMTFLNATLPAFMFAILVWSAVKIISNDANYIWTPAVWYLISSAVYFGLGPMVGIFSNEATRRALSLSVFSVTPSELLRTNMLSTIGVASVVFGIWSQASLRPTSWRTELTPANGHCPTLSPLATAFLFIVVGAALRYVVIKPAEWGLIDLQVPGTLQHVSSLIDVGFAVLAYLAARKTRRTRVLFLVLWPFHILGTLLSFSKTEIIAAFLLPALGFFIGNRKVLNLGIWLLAVGLAYTLSQPFITYSRAVVLAEAGNISEPGYIERLMITKNYIWGNFSEESVVLDDRQGWWTRLNYAGPQAFAMDYYDRGGQMNTLDNLWMRFIPRLVWPDKPFMANPGADLTFMMTGLEGLGFTGLTIYADAYWQFGWFGVVGVCYVFGWTLGIITCQSLRTVTRRDFIYLPAVLIGFMLSVQIPTQFLIDFVGTIPIYAGYMVVIGAIRLVLRRGALTWKSQDRRPSFSQGREVFRGGTSS